MPKREVVVLTITCTVEDGQDNLQVSGPIGDKLRCYGLLVGAYEIISGNKPAQVETGGKVITLKRGGLVT